VREKAEREKGGGGRGGCPVRMSVEKGKVGDSCGLRRRGGGPCRGNTLMKGPERASPSAAVQHIAKGLAHLQGEEVGVVCVGGVVFWEGARD